MMPQAEKTIPMAKQKLLIAETKDFSHKVVNLMDDHFELDLRELPSEELAQAFCQYDIFWFRLSHRIDAYLLNQPQRRVHTIVCPVTGLDHIDTETCRNLGIRIISLKGEAEFLKEVRATAELTLNLALSLIRKTHLAQHDALEGNWRRDLFKGEELYEKKIAIIGYGRLGKISADLYRAFGAKTVVYDHDRIDDASGHEIATSIEQALDGAFLLSLHISYSKENEGFLKAKHFELMSYGAYLVNTSRGSLLNETDLIQALNNGKLAGVATDVLFGEPEVQKSALWNYARAHKNVLITPHIGGNTKESFLKTEMFVGKKLIDSQNIE